MMRTCCSHSYHTPDDPSACPQILDRYFPCYRPSQVLCVRPCSLHDMLLALRLDGDHYLTAYAKNTLRVSALGMSGQVRGCPCGFACRFDRKFANFRKHSIRPNDGLMETRRARLDDIHKRAHMRRVYKENIFLRVLTLSVALTASGLMSFSSFASISLPSMSNWA